MITPRHLFFVCGLLIATHWLHQSLATYPVMFDEAQYWLWGKSPDWGYFSKPPMIAWLMGLSTALFGDDGFGVRMLAPVLHAIAGYFLYASARLLGHSRNVAAMTWLSYLTLPVVTGTSAFFTTEVPLLCCWAIGLYCILRALVKQQPWYWVLAGVCVGMGFLSKYTMIAFVASSLLALVMIPNYRTWLRTPYPWIGALVAFGLFAPNLWWNATHGFMTFAHTQDNVLTKHIELYPADMLAFAGAQLGIFGPILAVALIRALRQPKDSPIVLLLHYYVWPLLLVGLCVSLIAGAQAHWASPAYLAATLITVPWLMNKARGWLTASLVGHMLVAFLFYAAPTLLPHLPIRNPLTRVTVWNALADPVASLAKQYPDAVLISDERKIAAALSYELMRRGVYSQPVYMWPLDGAIRNHYSILTRQADLKGKPLMLIARNANVTLPKGAQALKPIEIDGYRFGVYRLRYPG